MIGYIDGATVAHLLGVVAAALGLLLCGAGVAGRDWTAFVMAGLLFGAASILLVIP